MAGAILLLPSTPSCCSASLSFPPNIRQSRLLSVFPVTVPCILPEACFYSSTGHSSWGNVSCVSDAVSGQRWVQFMGSGVCVILRACCFQVAELTRVAAFVIKPSVPP